ncbi:MarP family serine protease [Conexibacter sp. JD483]|uniref:MarP family serine protease n=1 Tax=unclassified Conexibacter TaxID=2627773 RepID=UPI002724B811|nr:MULTISPECIES: MarP family serine protease [unclassified Conexibacter]MDO8188860.1 MarP family serine protease [Conexibacter sp. CPCC 205706]MDO8200438.1 MarP family serine protease [Conexibacter sp. CPCC 205762]MDR9372645.1 MarP family serine protease [Conexibacter sp. JD483]
MTTIDWVIAALVALFALFGWQRGFIVGALSLAGFALGAVLGARVGPLLLPDGSHSPYAALFALAGALLVGGLLSSGLETLGTQLRRTLKLPGLGALDGALGALLSAALALGLVWVAGAVVLQTPGIRDLRADVQRSAVLRRLNELLPPSGPILNALARFDPLPSLHGPGADVPPPSRAVLNRPGVKAAAPSVVRILGNACGLGVEGSGWVAGDGLVVTNAHVVAGQSDTIVQRGGTGASLDATLVHFDPHNDVAVLAVPDLGLPALGLAPDPASGTAGAILGYPLNGPFDVRAARIGATRTVLSDDAYGNGPVSRALTTLRGRVRSGNSGGPVVDASGRVLTTVFAATTSGRPGGYGVPNAIVRRAVADGSRGVAVSSGPCAR